MGFYVEISHFLQNSIVVKEGAYVQKGDILGLCGNSGNSPEPHIHIQCQSVASLGAPTIPFFFSDAVLERREWLKYKKVRRGDFLTSFTFAKDLQDKFCFILDDAFTFDVLENGKKKDVLNIVVKMDAWGYYYFYDLKTGSKLYFRQYEDQFTFFHLEGDRGSYMKFFMVALPSVPFNSNRLSWEDSINPNFIKRYKLFYSLLKSFSHSLFAVKGSYQFNGEREIAGRVSFNVFARKQTIATQLSLAEHKGFESIVVKTDNELRLEVREV